MLYTLSFFISVCKFLWGGNDLTPEISYLATICFLSLFSLIIKLKIRK